MINLRENKSKMPAFLRSGFRVLFFAGVEIFAETSAFNARCKGKKHENKQNYNC